MNLRIKGQARFLLYLPHVSTTHALLLSPMPPRFSKPLDLGRRSTWPCVPDLCSYYHFRSRRLRCCVETRRRRS